LEPLEDRALLSVSIGRMPLTVPNSSSALHGPAVLRDSAAVATQLALRLPEDVPNGVPMPVKIVALDAQDHRVPNYSGTVTLTSSDPNATLPASVTFEHGFAVAKVILRTPGVQTLTATDNSTTPLVATASTTVAEPLVATQLDLHLPENVTSGVPVKVRLVAKDAQNERVPTYSATVTLTSTDPNITLPKTVTFEHGVAVFEVTFNTTGPQSLTATDASPTPLVATANTTVAAPLVAIELLMRMAEHVTSGVPVTVKLGAVDAQHHLVPNYSGTITLTSTDPNVALPKTITFDKGVAVFQVTFNTIGSQSLTATDNSATPLTITAETTVSAPVVAAQLVMHVPKVAISGRPVIVELVALDAQSHLVKDFTGTVTLTSSDPNVVLPKTITFKHGIAIFQVTFGTVGSQSLTATDNSTLPLTVTATSNVVTRPNFLSKRNLLR
jgi:DNA gyrase inhibitor GyrI